MQKIKMYLNKEQIIGIILATIMVIIIPIINDYKFVSLGWFFIGIANFGNAIFTKNSCNSIFFNGLKKMIQILKNK